MQELTKQGAGTNWNKVQELKNKVQELTKQGAGITTTRSGTNTQQGCRN
ncbi:hypothetical protein HYD97_03850 [Mycoplasmopsis bovis]|nr:hypothetical protein [Mycoplasmopsis bovis]QQH34522.1 hypothetical protein HYD97_03850 [Mycoplasmopsis bovis]